MMLKLMELFKMHGFKIWVNFFGVINCYNVDIFKIEEK
jgi:hypothetical protein